MNVLVAIPYKADMPTVLVDKMDELVERLYFNTPGFGLQVAKFSKELNTPKIPYAAPQAAARNALLDAHLKTFHDYVMWIDADLVDYPADIIRRLYSVNPFGITAPAVLIEGGDTFYDTYGFVEDGHKVRPRPPYFDNTDTVIPMEAVGCAYLAPAWLYLAGYRYSTTPDHTEHYSIMREAKAHNIKIVCDTNTVVYHANLPKYGLNWNGH